MSKVKVKHQFYKIQGNQAFFGSFQGHGKGLAPTKLLCKIAREGVWRGRAPEAEWRTDQETL